MLDFGLPFFFLLTSSQRCFNFTYLSRTMFFTPHFSFYFTRETFLSFTSTLAQESSRILPLDSKPEVLRSTRVLLIRNFTIYT